MKRTQCHPENVLIVKVTDQENEADEGDVS